MRIGKEKMELEGGRSIAGKNSESQIMEKSPKERGDQMGKQVQGDRDSAEKRARTRQKRLKRQNNEVAQRRNIFHPKTNH